MINEAKRSIKELLKPWLKSRKSIKYSQHALEEIVLQSFLVATGVRDGYLLEGISLDVDAIKALIEVTMKEAKCRITLVVLELGLDRIILNKDMLLQKLELLIEGLWDNHRHPLLIEVDGPSPLLCTKERREEIVHALKKSFQPTLDTLNSLESMTEDLVSVIPSTLQDCETLEREVSLPFVAGWLIGYPVCYRSVRSGEALNMQELEKISYIIQISPAIRLSVMEFTVPSAMLCETLESCIILRYEEMRVNAQMGASVQLLGSLSKIKVERSCQCYPSVVL